MMESYWKLFFLDDFPVKVKKVFLIEEFYTINSFFLKEFYKWYKNGKISIKDGNIDEQFLKYCFIMLL